MEAPISPNKRSHSSFDLFVEAAGKRFEDETFGGMYSNSVSSQSENEPPDFQNDIWPFKTGQPCDRMNARGVSENFQPLISI